MRGLNPGDCVHICSCNSSRVMSAAAGGGGNDGDAAASGPQLLCLSLNQDQTCLACGTDSGFVIYDLEPFQQRCFRQDVPVQGQLVPMGPLRIVTMLFRSNIFALVGTAANQSFPPNKVAIWDDIESGGKTIGVVTCSSEVKSVLLRRDKVGPHAAAASAALLTCLQVVVVLHDHVFVYNFMDLKLVLQIDTAANPRGLCCLCVSAKNPVVACPGSNKGEVMCSSPPRRTRALPIFHAAPGPH
jgi:hypothetical protein